MILLGDCDRNGFSPGGLAKKKGMLMWATAHMSYRMFCIHQQRVLLKPILSTAWATDATSIAIGFTDYWSNEGQEKEEISAKSLNGISLG